MYEAARDNNVRHMTAFTYRFAPSMRYLKHLVTSGALGTPRHFRSQRFLDLPETSWGWRQIKSRAGAGDLFDMTIHRIDFAQDLMGPIESVCGAVAQFAPRDRTADGTPCPPSEVDDWSALIGRFQKRRRRRVGREHADEGALQRRLRLRMGRSQRQRRRRPFTGSPSRTRSWSASTDESMQTEPVPAQFLVAKGSPRDPHEGVPSTVFRYDLVWEFVSAIVERRDAVPGFDAGASAQLVADKVLESYEKQQWMAIEGQTM